MIKAKVKDPGASLLLHEEETEDMTITKNKIAYNAMEDLLINSKFCLYKPLNAGNVNVFYNGLLFN